MSKVNGKGLKERIAYNYSSSWEPNSELKDITCHVRTHARSSSQVRTGP